MFSDLRLGDLNYLLSVKPTLGNQGQKWILVAHSPQGSSKLGQGESPL
jgi:hypothetical protein